MQWNLKKMWSMVAASMLLTTSFTHADSHDSALRNLENRLTALEQRRCVNGMINPPAMPLTRNGWGFQISADALLWQLQEDALTYAVDQAGGVSDPIFLAATAFPKQKYNWGFRIGLDWTIPHDNWDIAATWTHLISNSRKSSISSAEINGGALRQTQGFSDGRVLTVGPLNASAKYHNRLDQICLNMGREFFISKWVTLRPYFGLRSDWLRQRYHVSYSALTNNPDYALSVNPKNKWWGIGIESGLNAQLSFCGGFSLYGNAAYAIEYGLQKLRLNQSGTFFPEGFSNSFSTSYHICRPILDLQLGLGWDYSFCEDAFHFGLKLGWENHVYFNQSRFLCFETSNYSEVVHGGDLTYQGWTLHVNFDF